MSYAEQTTISAYDSPSVDAFGRWRISDPETLFDSKQIFDNQPLFWDESLETGAGITSSHSVDEAATTITSTLNTAGKFTRQTYQWFNYQPGKSQQILMTGTLDLSGGGTGVQRRIGIFNDDNGLFFEDDEGTMKVVIRSKVTGSVVNTKVEQSSWNGDTMDGNGPSGVTIDWSKSQIFMIDYEWLSVGRVRFGIVINGSPIYIHSIDNGNLNTGAYMSTPNLPLRYQIETTASSPASSMLCICSSVISEGGKTDLGIIRSANIGADDQVNANSIGTTYAVLGMRLKSACLGATIKHLRKTVLARTNDDFLWEMRFNPTVAGTFTYVDETNSCVQIAKGSTANPSTNTVTGGTLVDCGYIEGNTSSSTLLTNALHLGSAIDGTRDTFVLCITPLSSGLDIFGSLTWRELQ